MKLRLEKTILSRNKFTGRKWYKERSYSKDWEWELRAACGSKGLPKADGEKKKIIITSVRVRLLDHDNLVGGCKGLVDAMKRLEMIVDDSPDWVDIEYDQKVRSYSAHCQTVVEILN